MIQSALFLGIKNENEHYIRVNTAEPKKLVILCYKCNKDMIHQHIIARFIALPCMHSTFFPCLANSSFWYLEIVMAASLRLSTLINSNPQLLPLYDFIYPNIKFIFSISILAHPCFKTCLRFQDGSFRFQNLPTISR